jgi:hypothetical protein
MLKSVMFLLSQLQLSAMLLPMFLLMLATGIPLVPVDCGVPSPHAILAPFVLLKILLSLVLYSFLLLGWFWRP